MAYGYNSDTAFSKSVTDIEDEARILLDRVNGERMSEQEKARPIIFIAHSLGGVVTKKALIIANERREVYGNVHEATKAIFFFGTPHKGSDVAYWGTYAAQLVKAIQFSYGTNTNFVMALQRNSATFAEITKQFTLLATDIRIRTFYETEKLAGQLIVDRESAVLGLDNEVAVGLAASDHRTMCKYGSLTSQRYKSVWTAVLGVCQELGLSAKPQHSTLMLPRLDLDTGEAASLAIHQKEMEEQLDQSLLSNCLKVLYLTDHEDDLKAMEYERGSIIEGTCEWILSQQEYSNWLGTSNLQVLALVGAPGIGKTTIVRFLLQKLQSQISSNPDLAVLYYFCDNRDENRHSTTSILRSLIRQVLHARPSYFVKMQRDFKEIGEKLIQNVHTLWRYFTELLQQHKDSAMYILVDALDEIEMSSRNIFVHILSQLPAATGYLSQRNIKFLVTSRSESNLDILLEGNWPNIRIDSDKVNVDLSKYITEKVNDLAKKKRYPDDLRNDVEIALTESANGTFLWISFVVRDLAEARIYQVRARLKNLPSGLDEIYYRILQRIKPEDEEAAFFVLQWMAVAYRPMKVAELAIAFGMRNLAWPKEKLPSQSQVQELMDIYKPCEQLLSVDLKQDVINLIHPSVKDFLIGARLRQASGLSQYFVSIEETHLAIFETCWDYFEFQEFQQGARVVERKGSLLVAKRDTWTDTEFSDFLKSNTLPLSEKLLPYAEMAWVSHAQASGRIILSKSEWTKARLSKLPNLRDYWLHSCVRTGRHDLVRFLLHNGAKCNISTRGLGRRSALQEAVFNADKEMVNLLLENGADVNMKNELGTTAMYSLFLCKDWAVSSAIERLLLNSGAEPIRTKSRICTEVPATTTTILEARDIFDSAGQPNDAVVKNHFLLEGRLSETAVLKIVHQATEVFKAESNLLEIGPPVNICGAIHGHYFDLVRLFEVGGSFGSSNYLFLGNYVDRGCFSVECVLYLYILKLRYPQNLFMLRGNHECAKLSDYFTFKLECLHKYSQRVYEACLESFQALPLAAVVNRQFFCVSGGLSPELSTIDDIEAVSNPLITNLSLPAIYQLQINRFREPPLAGLFCDILWSNPARNFEQEEWFTHNHERGVSYFYSYKATCSFLEKNGLLSVITREKNDAGYRMYKRTSTSGFPSVMSIFSTPNYLDVYNNKAAILRFDGKVVNIRQFNCSPHPYWLPNFMDVFTWSVPFVLDKAKEFFVEVLRHITQDEALDRPPSPTLTQSNQREL
jgi:serine/threonine-protein phosphatase 2B catalytic subunit